MFAMKEMIRGLFGQFCEDSLHDGDSVGLGRTLKGLLGKSKVGLVWENLFGLM